MKNFFIFLFTLIVLILTVWILFTYVFISEEERIYRVIERGRRGVENGSLLTIQSILSDGSDANFNGMQRAELLGAMRHFFQETSDRKVRFVSTDIRVDEDKRSAEATIRFLFECTTRSSIVRRVLPLNERQTHTVYVTFSKSSGKWKMWRIQLNP